MEFKVEDSGLLVKTYGPEETEAIGRIVGARLAPGDVVSLTGELGAGKTCFTRGIALGLEVEKNTPIVSPSFTLINEYPGKIPLFHFDFYRIDDCSRIFDLGYQEYFYGDGVTVIEWGEKVAEFLPEEHLKIYFYFKDEEKREIKLQGKGERFKELIRVIADSR